MSAGRARAQLSRAHPFWLVLSEKTAPRTSHDADSSFGRILPTHRGLRRDGLRSGKAGTAASAEIDFRLLPFAVALSESELRSSYPHPAGAPRCCSPEPARRGINRLDIGRPRVTRSSAFANAEDRCGFDYFFFRRFVVFFAAAFFAFLFFAIAALLA